jgi:hypothetical protein
MNIHLVVFTLHDSAEIFGMESHLAFSTLKKKASTGVFVLLVCALNSVNKSFH